MLLLLLLPAACGLRPAAHYLSIKLAEDKSLTCVGRLSTLNVEY